MEIKLRKKAPFWCRHKSLTTGKYDCLTTPLVDTDTDLCPTHEAQAKAAREKFFSSPVKEKAEPQVENVPVRRIWP